MRKNHHGKKDRLVKRVFALCLALAVICTCLVPVFATEGLIDPQVNQEASRPVDDGEASYPDDEVAGFGGDEAAGFGEDEVATRPVEGGEEEATRPAEGEGGEDNLDGGPNVKETEWGTVIDYGTSTDTSSSTETQWSGEDDVVEKPDDKVVVSGDEIKKLQDMVVYRFWLKELNTLDLQDITAQAQINNMTESEYLARNGEVLWNLYFIQAVPRAETIADYSSYIENPSSNRDPKGELRLFDYWYTLDDLGNRVRLNLTDPTSNILDDKTTTVNVYAAWKDGTEGSYEDEPEETDHVPKKVEEKTETGVEKYKQWYDALVNAATPEIQAELLEKYGNAEDADAFGDYIETLSEKEQDVFNNICYSVSQMNGEGVALLTDVDIGDHGNILTVGESISVKCKDSNHNDTYRWNVGLYQDGQVDSNEGSKYIRLETSVDGTVRITALKATDNGEWICIRHGSTWEEYIFFQIQQKKDQTSAKVYYLKAPGYDANDNTPDVWLPKQNTSNWTAQINTTGATWETGNNRKQDQLGNWTVERPLNKNIYLYGKSDEVVKNYIKKWPDDSTEAKWVLKRGDATTGSTFITVLNAIWDDTTTGNYKEKLATDLGVSVDQLNKNAIKEITLVPYKISMNASNMGDLHVDCNITIKSTQSYTAVFWVNQPDNSGYQKVYAKDYSLKSDGTADKYVGKVTPNDIKKYAGVYMDEIADTKVYNGVTYQFVGWYPENTLGEAQGNDLITVSQWAQSGLTSNGNTTIGYNPSLTELSDGAVNFYAKYVPVSANLTVSKTVTGKLGDTNKAFTFQILNEEDQPVTLTNDNCQFGDGSGTLAEGGTTGKFTLKHGDTVTIKNLAPGTYKVTEIGDDLTGYETSWKVGTDGEVKEKSTEASVTMSGTNMTLAFTNHATLKPDTGVLLDTLPYIVILAVVAGGVALLMLRKHRKEDD